eukprot:3941414-Rhodomonas_salina.2
MSVPRVDTRYGMTGYRIAPYAISVPDSAQPYEIASTGHRTTGGREGGRERVYNCTQCTTVHSVQLYTVPVPHAMLATHTSHYHRTWQYQTSHSPTRHASTGHRIAPYAMPVPDTT